MAKKDNIKEAVDSGMQLDLIDRKLARLEESQDTNFTALGEKIDKIALQHPPLAPAPQPQSQIPIEVNLPDDIARSEDMRKLSGALQTTNCSISMVIKGVADIGKSISELPKPDAGLVASTVADETAARVVKELSPKFEDALKSIPTPVATPVSAIGNDEVKSINARLGHIEKSVAVTDKQERQSVMVRKVWLIAILNMVIAVGSLWWAFSLSEENEHLKQVEWLYRWSRCGRTDTQTFQEIERDMLFGTKKEREAMKTFIFNNERTAPQFQYFRPVDDWRPESPKPKEEAKPADTQTPQSSEKAQGAGQRQKAATKPKSNLTPSEIEAIKALRTNPHIPEEAKPPLPKGY